MEMLDSYKDYRKHRPEYNEWKNNQEELEAKRLAYVKEEGVDEFQKKEGLKRAKAVLNAVDIMDEYSQSRAEDAEIVVQSITNQVAALAVYPGMGLGALIGYKALKGSVNKEFKVLMGALVGGIASAAIIQPLLAQWGAKKETQASQNGRFEAMTKDLSCVKQFAVLDDKQEEEVENIAKTIDVPKKEAQKLNRANGGIFKAIKFLIKGEEDEITKARKEFKKTLKEDEEKFDKVQLSEKQIEEAKRDQQLIQNVVEKIDIASQEYAEDVELATDALNAAGLGSGAVLGAALYKILGLFKVSNKKRLYSALGLGGVLAVGASVLATKLQKQASRVGRFKAKQDFINNPDKLIYVDNEKAKDKDPAPYKTDNKKPAFFKFIAQLFKENKEYNDYIKENSTKIKQEARAREQIELTPEQEKRARQLQQNVFKMFNKLDDKSQKYAEHIEALGETVQNIVSSAATLFMMSGLKDLLKISGSTATDITKGFKPLYRNIAIAFPFVTALNIYVTKEQKKASRVADMLAVKETEDYRHFVDYSAIDKPAQEEKAATSSEAPISPLLKARLNK